ncbi:hypothetical protein JTP77_025550 [Streptomyces sp. S9]|nr:hypothetical protein [Streptomyces sp. S9]
METARTRGGVRQEAATRANRVVAVPERASLRQQPDGVLGVPRAAVRRSADVLARATA